MRFRCTVDAVLEAEHIRHAAMGHADSCLDHSGCNFDVIVLREMAEVVLHADPGID